MYELDMTFLKVHLRLSLVLIAWSATLACAIFFVNVAFHFFIGLILQDFTRVIQLFSWDVASYLVGYFLYIILFFNIGFILCILFASLFWGKSISERYKSINEGQIKSLPNTIFGYFHF